MLANELARRMRVPQPVSDATKRELCEWVNNVHANNIETAPFITSKLTRWGFKEDVTAIDDSGQTVLHHAAAAR